MDRNGAGAGAGAVSPGLSRAQRFEDEKRRIIDSCFNKKDPDGSLQETYITHIRITEYSSHPTAPPPPQLRNPDTEKPRVIIVAVRKTGRVRMHKSKENSNGTFSIGKTWNLDDLSHIQSYSSPTVDATLRQYAGDTGFLVTIQKPYFWHAQTPQEKKFFIASLIKIYGKYTNGRAPELSGFDQRELDQVMGRRPPPTRPPMPDSATSQRSVSSTSTIPLPSASAVPQGVPSPISPGQLRNVYTPTGASSPAGSIDSTRSQNQATLRRLAGSNKSQDSVANSFNTARSEDATSLPPRSRGGITGPTALGRFGDATAEPVPNPTATISPPEERPPERKRPPMDPTRPQPFDRDLVPAPLMSPGLKRDPAVPPRSMDRMSPRKNSLSQRSEGSSFQERIVSQTTEPSRADSFNSLKSPSQSTFSRPSISNDTAANEDGVSPVEPDENRPGLGPMIKSRRPRGDVGAPPEEPDESRPGLGPMIKAKKSKGDIAGSLWKAASAAGAFRPRPGGAGERLRMGTKKSEDGPDGITSVVPAPPRPVSIPEPKKEESPEPLKTAEQTPGVPEVKVTVPHSSRPSSLQSVPQDSGKSLEQPPKEQPQEEDRRPVLAGNDAKYMTTLGIDPAQIPTLIENPRSAKLREWMDNTGFVPGEQMRVITWERMKSELDRELDKAQAGGWLSRFREEDERVEGIKDGIDQVINECDQLDDLLTLYSAGLGTIASDIDYLEAQAEGIQVQVANEKALQKELQMLTDTCALDRDWDVEPLSHASFEKANGLADIEHTLLTLYKTMRKIDPSLCGYDVKDKSAGMGSDLAQLGDDLELAAALGLDADPDQPNGLASSYGRMQVVRDKRDLCLEVSTIFVNRFLGQMRQEFEVAFGSTKNMLDRALSRKTDREIYQTHRRYLWRYCSLTLYARDMHLDSWNEVLQRYQDQAHPLFRNSFGSVIESWKANAKKSTGEEAELLFTAQPEKPHEGIATAARKLTVKRSQTLAGRFRSDAVKSIPEKTMDSRSTPYEVFRGVLDDLLPLIEMEQNFIIDFFHATTIEEKNFAEFLRNHPPGEDRKVPDYQWLGFRRMEPDRELARRVTRAMEVIFSFLESDLQRLIDWVISNNPLHGVGVLAALESKMEAKSGSNQEFLNMMLQKLQSSLEGRFKRFVDEQIRAIEETKVKMVKKRRGVIHFFRVFPQFSSAVENILATFHPGAVNVRHMVNEDYGRILKAMFDSLKVIARENKGLGVSASSTDPEDKEALNYHILLIENLSYFIEEMAEQQQNHHVELDVLEDRKQEAIQEYGKHLDQYLSSVMRRPLGKLLDYLENVEAQLQALKAPERIAAQPSNSKTVFNKILGTYDAKEVRKGIEALRKRIEKHFGDADEPGASVAAGGKELVEKVTEECEKFYGRVELRIASITAEVYGGDVLFEWPRAEVKSAFAAK